MDTRRLHAFVKIVDIGSLTRAAAILHIAQPALSQQIVALETHFGKQLLVRSKRGVVPTDAGRALYRHAQVMLRQLEQAETDIKTAGTTVAGRVSVGLAPLSTAAALALPLLKTVRERYPGIVLQINENIGGVISEQIMTGKMDVAFIYDPGPIRGVDFEPILTEDLFFVAPSAMLPVGPKQGEIAVEEVARLDLVLPTRIHTVRQLVDTTFRRVGVDATVIAEIESVPTIGQAIWAGLGATILPWSSANAIFAGHGDAVSVKRIVKPSIPVKVSICTSDQLPLSEPAKIVSDLLADLARQFAGEHLANGVRAASPVARRSR